jgi:hypothetical protein
VRFLEDTTNHRDGTNDAQWLDDPVALESGLRVRGFRAAAMSAPAFSADAAGVAVSAAPPPPSSGATSPSSFARRISSAPDGAKPDRDDAGDDANADASSSSSSLSRGLEDGVGCESGPSPSAAATFAAPRPRRRGLSGLRRRLSQTFPFPFRLSFHGSLSELSSSQSGPQLSTLTIAEVSRADELAAEFGGDDFDDVEGQRRRVKAAKAKEPTRRGRTIPVSNQFQCKDNLCRVMRLSQLNCGDLLTYL